MSELSELFKLVRAWVEKAEHDLKTAEHTLKLGDDCPFDTVCFHAQQCAEKYLKTLLVLHQRDFPKTHDMGVLARLLPPEAAPKIDVDDLLTLNRYPIEARYPGEWESMSRLDAEEALGVAQRLRAVVRALLPRECVE